MKPGFISSRGSQAKRFSSPSSNNCAIYTIETHMFVHCRLSSASFRGQPDLGDINRDEVEDAAEFVHALEPSQIGVSYIYPIPSTLNCSGTVAAVGYCYRAGNSQLGTQQLVFTLLTLQQDTFDFTITDVIEIRSTPTSDNCIQISMTQYCCDILSLDMMDSFLLPAENFAFGVVTSSSLLGFNGQLVSEYIVEHFEYVQASFSTPVIGNTIALTMSNEVSDRTLRLLTFYISKLACT